jgi:SAM-dependent methyltransferase
MVHALEEIRRLLKPDGVLIDIHGDPEGEFIEAHQGGRRLFSERIRETCSENGLRTEEALAQAVERELFIIDRREEFDFLTYASSVPELRAYWEELEAYWPEDEVIAAREEYLYAQVEEIMQASGAGTEVATYERARITRLRPVRR